MATTAKSRQAHDGQQAHDRRQTHEGHQGHGGHQPDGHLKITATNVTAEDRKFLEYNGAHLSKTTLRAQWIHESDEHEDRPGQSLATREHAVIQHWADERSAKPATVPTKNAEEEGRPRVLRFDFPGYGGRKLEAIDWDTWFQPFDERDLVFIFQEHKTDGSQSNFFRLDSPKREDG